VINHYLFILLHAASVGKLLFQINKMLLLVILNVLI